MSLYSNYTIHNLNSTNVYLEAASVRDDSNETNSSKLTLNASVIPSGCFLLHFEEFIPWNNPGNIISLQTEDYIRKVKNLVILPILSLIGCPANIINMAVFYKQGFKDRINICLFALSLADGLFMANSILWYGEQLPGGFSSKETDGPIKQFVTNHNLIGFYGLIGVSQLLSAIVAADRCFCVLQPLRSQTMLRNSTMTVIIVTIYVIILTLYFILVSRYRITCAYNPLSDTTLMTFVPGEFYLGNHELIEFLDIYVFGAGLPGFVIGVVVTTTIITAIKLRQAATWRASTSSSVGLSQREIALTKMLVGNSVFFIICVLPFVVLRVLNIFMPEMNVGRRQHNFFMASQWILIIVSYFNSTFNIVVYYTMGSRYRQTFWQLFRKQKRTNHFQNTASTSLQ